MKLYFLLFINLISFFLETCSIISPRSDRISYQTINRFADRIGKKYNMTLIGIGGGDNEGIWLMSAYFDRQGLPLNLSEARKLIIDVINEFLTEINNDIKLKPYLKNYPFNVNNIDLCIVNYDFNQKGVFDPYMDTLSLYQGKIHYWTRDPEDWYKYKSETEETYEEAIAILEQERQG